MHFHFLLEHIFNKLRYKDMRSYTRFFLYSFTRDGIVYTEYFAPQIFAFIFSFSVFSRISVSRARVFPLPFFFPYIIKDKIAGWEKDSTPLPCYSSLLYYRNCKMPTLINDGGFSGEGEAMGMENVLQTCLAIPKRKRRREKGTYDSNKRVTRFGVQG